ncbi:putative E3 ubiquitin-protein ligase dbl4 [Blattamonas nauphoetae]|uniref:Poly [ADP-ribose] polymerase n=1 Tax=Blattamonas nauphoetae TaxID=2049346 RepID=A0ABQ9YFV4_9EUKA|nr:putative E3 ubiquitin-protein ligase dbl4 [Blattamonas nauphoetae]
MSDSSDYEEEEEYEEEVEEISEDEEIQSQIPPSIPSVQQVRRIGPDGDSFNFLKHSELIVEIDKIITNSQSIFGRSRDDLLRSLFFAEWNQEKIETGWIDIGDEYEIEVGIRIDNMEPIPKFPLFCPMCNNKVDTLDDCQLFPCNHLLCRSCFDVFLNYTLSSPTALPAVSCSYVGCTCVLPPSMIENYSSAFRARFEEIMMESFIKSQNNLRQCPNPKCNWIAKRNDRKTNATCLCHTRFCFSCGKEPHEPLPCRLLNTFTDEFDLLKRNDATRIEQTPSFCLTCATKLIPRIGTSRGTCPQCLEEPVDQCCLCSKKWATHGANPSEPYTCHSVSSLQLGNDMSGILVLATYTDFYLQRFLSHDRSQQFFVMKQNHILDLIGEYQKHYGSTPGEAEFIREGIGLLVQAHCAIKFSFILALFMNDDGVKIKFEMRQQSLIQHTESLSELLLGGVEEMGRMEALILIKKVRFYLSNYQSFLEDEPLHPRTDLPPSFLNNVFSADFGANWVNAHSTVTSNLLTFLRVIMENPSQGRGAGFVTQTAAQKQAEDQSLEIFVRLLSAGNGMGLAVQCGSALSMLKRTLCDPKSALLNSIVMKVNQVIPPTASIPSMTVANANELVLKKIGFVQSHINPYLGQNRRNAQLTKDQAVSMMMVCNTQLREMALTEPTRQTVANSFCSTSQRSISPESLVIFEVHRADEEARFRLTSHVPNHRYLFHGSPAQHWLSILGTGLTLQQDPRYVMNGTAKAQWGIFFADLSAKAQQYAQPASDGLTTIGVFEVALGHCQTQTDFRSRSTKETGYSHTRYSGTEPTKWVPFRGQALMPFDGKNSGTHSEYIVYTTEQVCLRYLVRFK